MAKQKLKKHAFYKIIFRNNGVETAMKLSASLILGSLLLGCQSTSDWSADDDDYNNSEDLQTYANTQRQLGNESFNGHSDAAMLQHWAREPHRYLNQYHNNVSGQASLSVSDYVESLAMRLVKSMKYVNQSTPIAISSFVPMDSNLEETSLIGLHLAENFIHEAQQLGLTVIDYKSTGTIRVTKDGDFALSRDIDELRQWHPIEYVLTGTYSIKESGIEVHARVVGLESRAVVASAQGFIPNSVTQQLRTHEKRDGIKITKG